MNFITKDIPLQRSTVTNTTVVSSGGGGGSSIQYKYLQLDPQSSNLVTDGVIQLPVSLNGLFGSVTGDTANYLIGSNGWIFRNSTSNKNIASIDDKGKINVGGLNISNGTQSVNLIVDVNGNLLIDGTVAASGDVMAFGSVTGGTNTGGGLIQTVFGYQNINETFLDTDLTNTFNAYTINLLHNRLNLVENTNYLTGLTGSLVVNALGYTPYNSSNPSGFITGINNSMVLTALGYTPIQSTDTRLSDARSASDVYGWAKQSTKPSYNWAEIGSKPTLLSSFTNDLGNYGGFVTGTPWTGQGYITASALTPYVQKAGDVMTGNLTTKGLTITNGTKTVNLVVDANGYLSIDNSLYSSGDVSAFSTNGSGGNGSGGLIQAVYSYANLGGSYSNATLTDTFNAYTINQMNNRLIGVENGALTQISSALVTNALGFTPYNATNPNGYITTSSLNGYLSLNGGSMNNTNMVNGLNAQYLGGIPIWNVHINRENYYSNVDANTIGSGYGLNTTGNGTGNSNFPYGYGNTINYDLGYGRTQLHFNHIGELTIRSKWGDNWNGNRIVWDSVNFNPNGKLDYRTFGSSVNYNVNNTGNNGTPWNTIPLIKPDGVMEVGRYIDFHINENESIDYTGRLQVDGTYTLKFNGQEVYTGWNFNPANYLPLAGGNLTGQLYTSGKIITNDLFLNTNSSIGNQILLNASGANYGAIQTINSNSWGLGTGGGGVDRNINNTALIWDINKNISTGGNLTVGGLIVAATGQGFKNQSFQGGYNRIWSFGSGSEPYGMGYYQGTNSSTGSDAIGFHFGDINNPLFYIKSNSEAIIKGDLSVGNSEAPKTILTNNICGYGGTGTLNINPWGGSVLVSGGNSVIHSGNIGTQSVSNSSTADRAGFAYYLPTSYAGGQQTNPQVYFNNNIGLKVSMTGYPYVWSDTLWINGYAGSDVPNMCAMHFLRNGQPRAWISSQYNSATSYGTSYEFLTEYNYGGFVVPKVGGTFTGGLNLSNNEIQGVSRISHGNGSIILSGNLHIDSYNGFDIYNQYYSNREIQNFGHTRNNGRDITGVGSLGTTNVHVSNAVYFNGTANYLNFESGSIHSNGSININGVVQTGTHFKTSTPVGLVGDYNENSSAEKIIWTIGSSWATLANHYGLGYTYNNIGGFGHSIFFANNGTKHIQLSLEYGNAHFDGTGYFGNSLIANGTFTAYGNILNPIDNSYLAIGNDGNIGFTKKAGASGKMTFAAGTSFVIAQSNSSNIQAYNTFTDKLTLDGNGSLIITGNFTANGEITAYSSSDIRLKQNIKPLNKSLELINKLNPVQYNWNEKAKELNPNKDDKTDVGVIAQELEKILPNLVHNIYNDEFLSVDYVKLIPYLIGAIQELTQEINTLKNNK